jgi:hypothetical protein
MLAKMAGRHGLGTLLQGDRFKKNRERRGICGQGVLIQGMMINAYVANRI